MTNGVVNRDGFLLQWRREGTGIPMLVLGASRFYPRYFPQAMREHFDMVFCDTRQWVATPGGFDLSTLTRDMSSDDVEEVRRVVGLERPIVMGHSQHGYQALAFAQRYPDRVRGAVCIASGAPNGEDHTADFWERDASPERKAADARIRASIPAPAEAHTAAEFIDGYLANTARFWFDPDVETRYLWDGIDINLDAMRAMWSDNAFGSFRIERSDMPTFLALGRYDYGNPYYEWDEFRPLFSNLTYRLYERSSHQPPFEQPEEFTADLVAWAAGLEA